MSSPVIFSVSLALPPSHYNIWSDQYHFWVTVTSNTLPYATGPMSCVLLYYIHFVFYCTHVRMSYVLNSYLLTYLLLKKLVHLSVCNVGALWPNGWMDQDITWYRGRPWPRWHCVIPAPPHIMGNSSPSTFRPKSIAAKWSPISATAELLVCSTRPNRLHLLLLITRLTAADPKSSLNSHSWQVS